MKVYVLNYTTSFKRLSHISRGIIRGDNKTLHSGTGTILVFKHMQRYLYMSKVKPDVLFMILFIDLCGITLIKTL